MNKTFTEKEITIHDYIAIIYRHKWTIILSFVVIVGITIYHNLTRPPVFESVATFIIESTNVEFPGSQNVTMKESVRPFDFYKAVINSRSFKKQASKAIIDSCAHYPQNDLTPGIAWNLVSTIRISNLEYSDFVELKARAFTPELAYLTAKIGTNALKIRCQEIDREEYQNIVSFVQNQRSVALDELESIEQNLQKILKNNNSIFHNEEDGGFVTKLMNLEEKLIATQTERELAEANLQAYVQRLNQAETKIDLYFEQNNDSKITQMREELSKLDDRKNHLLQEFGSDYPEIESLNTNIEHKKKQLVRLMMASSGIENNVGTDERTLLKDLQERKITEELNIFILKNREKYYRKLIEKFKKEHPNLMENAIEVAKLNRAKAVQQNLYNFLLEKGEEAKIKAATGTGGIRMIDPPTLPNQPVPSRAKSNILLAIFVGLGLGVGIAFLREYLDNSIRSDEDVTSYLEIPLMGVVPIIKHQNGFLKVEANESLNRFKENYSHNSQDSQNGSILISRLKPKDPLVETYRGLRTNLQFTAVDNPIKSIVVTSSNPREGKTVTSANLAISYAEMGLKTLLVDADLRKPQQHKLFRIEKSPGLLECLVNDLDVAQVMHETNIPNLKIIPAGKNPPNPAEIVGSRKMKDFIAQLHQQNDMIIFDTPPVIAVTDPLLLGAHVGGILLVIKFRKTTRNVARNALETLKRAKLNVIGAVLNQTLFTKGYGYYRNYYHYYYYSDDGERKQRKKSRRKSV